MIMATKKTTTKTTKKRTTKTNTGRPQKVTDEQLIAMAEQYLSEEHIPPILEEYALSTGLSSNRIYERAKENPELSSAIKKIIDKKKIILERGALLGELNSSMAIFSLKQVGWSDHKDDSLDKDNKIQVIMEAAEEYAD